MDLKTVQRILQSYEELLSSRGIPIERWEKPSPPEWPGQLAHARWMCSQVRCDDSFTTDKAQRWLGFVQGVLWATGSRTIEQMKADNR